MTAEIVDEQAPITESRARVRLANGPLTGPVLCRVVSMVLTRADWPMDRLDDAMLVCDALCAHAPAHATDGRLTFSVQAHDRAVELRVQELSAEGAAKLVRDATLPGVGNVLERIADSLSIEPGERGMGSQLVLVLTRAG
jgi:serine/threonine-protein kinase RsbW